MVKTIFSRWHLGIVIAAYSMWLLCVRLSGHQRLRTRTETFIVIIEAERRISEAMRDGFELALSL